jgi:hypothetical protein
MLDNGTELVGARISAFVIDRHTRSVVDAGLAFDTIYGRDGTPVDSAADLTFGGLNRLCSAGGAEAGTHGFVDAVFLTGEETGGGTFWVLDVDGGALWAAPALGVGGWESATPLNIPSINETHVALILGDDRGAAPLYLYIGEKDLSEGANFLERNGLASGGLYMWKADDGSLMPADFTGTDHFKKGCFIEVVNYAPGMAGTPGYDELGYATQANLDGQRDALGAFHFSRPEDVHTNPWNGHQVIFASTGRKLGDDDSDLWGTTYLVDVKLNQAAIKKNSIKGHIRVAFDGDDAEGNGLPHPDFGIRSPDNLTWAGDEYTYIQEDRSIGAFGDESGEETSIWQLQPHSGEIMRIAQMNRDADLPAGQYDNDPLDLGDWESSGIIDVSELFGEEPGNLLFFNVQAHSVKGGAIDSENLVQGGQLLFLSK